MKKLSGIGLSFLFCIEFLFLSCSPIEKYKNIQLPVEVRAHDLVSRMTLDEKISQMMDVADSIPRLGIPEYNWWNEGLHGVARAGVATVFPQAIGMAATFDDSLLFDVANVISDEFRAKYNEAIRKNEHERYQGLTVWSPNINIFRDPRWGRGQETYGEDPYLTSRMGVVFVKGLQGNNPNYFKTIATPKHYAVHSGPEPLRHAFDVDVSERDFIDTYLPAFEACVIEGKAGSVMSAYNRFRGKSCTGSPLLLTNILRDKWGFKGYVVSDCGAVDDIYSGHKIAGSLAEASAIAVKAGCDLNCGDTYRYLKEAIEKGFLKEADLDTALQRLFEARFRLGMFDPQNMVSYNKIPIEVNDNQEHRELSKKAARETIVLLKNENNVLPLNKNLKKIAVIGPAADEAEVMYGNYNGFPSRHITPFEGIKNKVSEGTEVYYSRGVYFHKSFPLPETVNSSYLESDGKSGLKGEYFSNVNLEGTPSVVRQDGSISFWWGPNRPLKGISNENYSVRWTGNLKPPLTGEYLFKLHGDDGYRMYLDDTLIIDNWDNKANTSLTSKVELQNNRSYSVRVEYFHKTSNAYVGFDWAMPKIDEEKNAIEIAKKSDVIIFVGGLSPSLEGEEMSIDLVGFHGGDRTSIDLPEVQLELLKKLKATGKPVILVLLNGSALAVNWASQNLPAIVEAWYPGQEGGTAIADVLFGDYNPAGRLPVTFYKSTDQLPPFESYDMKGRTYRYFDGEPLYKFGFGLSYTQFKYSNLIAPVSVFTDSSFMISAEVENTGNFVGDEVVELYLKHIGSDVSVPILALEGFRRIHLEKGERKRIEFKLSSRHLSVISNDNQRIVAPGLIQLFVGGSQPDSKALEDNKILSAEIKLEGDTYFIK
jgi:beta-glucosidase